MRKDRIIRSGAAGLNVRGQQDALDDLRLHIEIGVVKADTGDSHFEIADGDVWVDCIIMPTEQPITCRLSTIAGGPGHGVWMVPPNGAEVVIACPSGQIEGGGIIIAVLPGGTLPAGVVESKIVIVAPEVLVYDTNEGDAKALPTMEEFKNHTHTSAGSGSPSSTPIDPIIGVGNITGTTVLKAE